MNKKRNELHDNPMYVYLKNHGYISQSKKSYRQSELSNQRAECIANKYNSLIQQNQEGLIKYIEDFINKTDYEVNIKGNYLYLAWSNAYKDLLERIKNNNYEK